MTMNLLRILAISLLLQSSSPVAIDKVMPAYPALAKAAQIEGTVQISLTVGPDGKVREARILSSSNPLLLTGAIDAARQWLFQPSENGGVVTIEIPYELHHEPDPEHDMAAKPSGATIVSELPGERAMGTSA